MMCLNSSTHLNPFLLNQKDLESNTILHKFFSNMHVARCNMHIVIESILPLTYIHHLRLSNWAIWQKTFVVKNCLACLWCISVHCSSWYCVTLLYLLRDQASMHPHEADWTKTGGCYVNQDLKKYCMYPHVLTIYNICDPLFQCVHTAVRDSRLACNLPFRVCRCILQSEESSSLY